VIGFSVKNDADTQMFGINTQLLKHPIPKVRAGQKIACVWEIPNILNDGSYFIDVAAHDADGKSFDWWEEASLFTIFKEEKSPFVVSPDIKVELHTEGV
jgi:hypothetical protein